VNYVSNAGGVQTHSNYNSHNGRNNNK